MDKDTFKEILVELVDVSSSLVTKDENESLIQKLEAVRGRALESNLGAVLSKGTCLNAPCDEWPLGVCHGEGPMYYKGFVHEEIDDQFGR